MYEQNTVHRIYSFLCILHSVSWTVYSLQYGRLCPKRFNLDPGTDKERKNANATRPQNLAEVSSRAVRFRNAAF